MNDQHLDFIPDQADDEELDLFTDVSPEDLEKANEVLKDCPEPDYSTMTPPPEEECSFIVDDDEEDDCPTFTSDEGVFIMDDGDYPPPPPGIDAEIDDCSEAIQKAVDAILKKYPDEIYFMGHELGMPIPLAREIRHLIRQGLKKEAQRQKEETQRRKEQAPYVPSVWELEEEFGPMDEDDIPTFEAIYLGGDDDDGDEVEDNDLAADDSGLTAYISVSCREGEPGLPF